MRQSKLFGQTLRENPKDETSVNARLLERGGFVYKNSAGVYSYLPLGWRVLGKIAGIIRKEMNAIGGQEMFMPALVEKKYLDATGRWDVPVGFEVKGKNEKTADFVLGWTHEEVLTAIAKRYISSYKDLPFGAYQIQTKFRNEPRAKSGLLRGREFMMKDLYSFHSSEEDFKNYYAIVKEAYFKIFEQCGLKSFYTVAAGGNFTSSNTHEFQVLSQVGEDKILLCLKCEYAENKEISKLGDGDKCPKCGGKIKIENAIEVGNIFPLGEKYSSAFNLQFIDSRGKKENVVMGSYGIGLGRVIGTAVEVYHDDQGIIWPKNIAPFQIHLIELSAKDNLAVKKQAEKIYEIFADKGVEILYDDRADKTAGEKFADADLIGIPLRIVISAKTLENNSIELKKRNKKAVKLIKISDVESII
ncbi:MAG: Prolyl-tRNA synthetase [Parcubacteria group bacterium GW2011_GWC1_43_61]|nr:MAG: Prolyl-tRNA synthetase [Candidatus Azambacteria bacterium GW2011_GWF1_41_10]KKS49113.1 MAG: Prolyl-tRNA synthetase [Candidatus Azambacteria bacterium GW2011_GWF2_42_22]KKS69820.1 MAG: Prolyl-tRNA synthetase [Candidatus Azambacteria bacterium GW2011_GWA2_42_62]KKS74535.1 MAG: Prolyl-tRNA synthetase [Candidatus Azambacteria bacterium GW2011_GWB1_42_72]KKT03307.1 MAG: Prolyl-tRNA synthetase [Candidatus Azambacteria bacterium GW2011_GWD1_43_18]KKT12616.1 MAG: Prolyl-tRNA synthetase [Candid